MITTREVFRSINNLVGFADWSALMKPNSGQPSAKLDFAGASGMHLQGRLVLEMEALLELLELEQLRRHGDAADGMIYVRKVFGKRQHNGNEN